MEGKQEAYDERREERAGEFVVSRRPLGTINTTRASRVNQIRARVRSGRYEVDPSVVAEALLKRPAVLALLRSR